MKVAKGEYYVVKLPHDFHADRCRVCPWGCKLTNAVHVEVLLKEFLKRRDSISHLIAPKGEEPKI